MVSGCPCPVATEVVLAENVVECQLAPWGLLSVCDQLAHQDLLHNSQGRMPNKDHFGLFRVA